MTARSLAGLRVVVPRPRDQAAALVEALEAAGATAVEVPAIEIVDPDDGGLMLRHSIRDLRSGDWLVLTSPNGVSRVAAALDDDGLANGVCVAAIGPGTRARAEGLGLDVGLVPERSIAEGLLDVFPPPPPSGGRVVLARAEQARQALPIGLRAMGWTVDDVAAYRTVAVPVDDEGAAACAAADVVAFTSSSTVTHLVDAVGPDGLPGVVASIGPATSATARGCGIRVDLEARQHSIPGLVMALMEHVGG